MSGQCSDVQNTFVGDLAVVDELPDEFEIGQIGEVEAVDDGDAVAGAQT